MNDEDKIKHTCRTCEHENDSNPEYCGTCNGENWREAGWHIEKRLLSLIKELQAETERLKDLFRELHFYNCGACEDNMKIQKQALHPEGRMIWLNWQVPVLNIKKPLVDLQ